eukprot:1137602-Pelagomonas_calceolata.AAC.7
MYKVTLMFLFGFLELQLLSLVEVLACWAVAASRVGKGLVSEQNLSSTRVNKDSIRAALVPGRGASTNSQSGRARDMFSGAKTGMVPISVHPIHRWVGKSKGNVINAVHLPHNRQRAELRVLHFWGSATTCSLQLDEVLETAYVVAKSTMEARDGQKELQSKNVTLQVQAFQGNLLTIQGSMLIHGTHF